VFGWRLEQESEHGVHDNGRVATRNDSADDANLLADLAEATGGLALQAFGETEILAAPTPDQVKSKQRRTKSLLRLIGVLGTMERRVRLSHRRRLSRRHAGYS
jgi:hypothetical protein